MELLHTARLACLLIVFWNEIRSNESTTSTMATMTMTPPMMYTCEYNFTCNLIVYFKNAGDLGSCNNVVSPMVDMTSRPNVALKNASETNESFWLVMFTPDSFYPSCNYTGFLPIRLNWAVKANSTANSTTITLAAEDSLSYSTPKQSEETAFRYQLLLYPMKTTGNENPFLMNSSGLNMSELFPRLNLTHEQPPNASFQFRLQMKPKEMPQESTTMPTVTDPGPVMPNSTEKAAEVGQSSLSTCLKPTIPRGLMTMIGIVLAVVLA